jgi:hypothetical protein
VSLVLHDESERWMTKGSGLDSHVNIAAERGDEASDKISQEVKDEVTPEMIEAGKLAISKLPKNETCALEKSIVKIYMAMAAASPAPFETVCTRRIDRSKTVPPPWGHRSPRQREIPGCILRVSLRAH